MQWWNRFTKDQPVLSVNLKYGIGLGIYLFLLSLLTGSIGSNLAFLSTIIAGVSIIVIVLCYLRTSYLAASKTDRMTSGTLAGLATGIIAYLIDLLGHLLLFPLSLAISHAEINPAVQLGAIMTALISSLVIYGFLGGIVVGFIGGNIGIHHYSSSAAGRSQPAQSRTATTPPVANE